MPCGKQYEIWQESDKAQKKWIDSKILEKWGFNNDLGAFKRLFEASTGKVLMSGEQLQPKDFKKMTIAIEKLEKDLRSPGALSSKVLKHFYVGQAETMRNPITKDFYETLINANEFRNRHNSEMMANYSSLISDLKLAMMDFKGEDTYNIQSGSFQKRDLVRLNDLKAKLKVNKTFKELNKREIALTKRCRRERELALLVQRCRHCFLFLRMKVQSFRTLWIVLLLVMIWD